MDRSIPATVRLRIKIQDCRKPRMKTVFEDEIEIPSDTDIKMLDWWTTPAKPEQEILISLCQSALLLHRLRLRPFESMFGASTFNIANKEMFRLTVQMNS